MVRPLELAGKTFNRLTVIRRHGENSKAGKSRWVCMCSCGNQCVFAGSDIKSGNVKSCGCLHVEGLDERNTKHNNANRGNCTREYSSWSMMKSRCYNKKYHKYPRYGGRGIVVCARWLGDDGFKNFLADMGPRPDKMTLDRKNNDGNYEPGNCRWATALEQARNK